MLYNLIVESLIQVKANSDVYECIFTYEFALTSRDTKYRQSWQAQPTAYEYIPINPVNKFMINKTILPVAIKHYFPFLTHSFPDNNIMSFIIRGIPYTDIIC